MGKAEKDAKEKEERELKEAEAKKAMAIREAEKVAAAAIAKAEEATKKKLTVTKQVATTKDIKSDEGKVAVEGNDEVGQPESQKPEDNKISEEKSEEKKTIEEKKDDTKTNIPSPKKTNSAEIQSSPSNVDEKKKGSPRFFLNATLWLHIDVIDLESELQM